MTRSRMVPAVLQTITLSALALVVSHHLLSNAFQNASNSELWRNITSAVNASAQAQARLNGTANNQILTNGTFLNGTAANITVKDIFSSNGDNESFYWSTFPRELFILMVISPLYYHWHIWLERFLPGRPPVRTMISGREKPGVGEDDSHEEEIVQRWIAHGKVRRASLSWWNTFCKWILNLTVGSLWMESLRFLLAGIIESKSPVKAFRMMFGWDIPFRIIRSFLDIRPLASLIAFIVVPAHLRMTFEAGARLVWDLFFGVFMNVMMAWIAKSPFVQNSVGIWVEAMNNHTAKDGLGPSDSQFPGFPHEL